MASVQAYAMNAPARINPAFTADETAGLTWLEAAIERGERQAARLEELEAFPGFARCPFPSDEVFDAMQREGVNLEALDERWEEDLPRHGWVEYHSRPDRFEFAPEDGVGSGALIFAVRDSSGCLIDLAAWSPPRPPALWLGDGALLGSEHLFGFRMREQLIVHETILDWLRAACVGVVILDVANAAPLLRSAAPLLVARRGFGNTLDRALTLRPQIFVSKHGGGEAMA
jgi:hypothetical protein